MHVSNLSAPMGSFWILLCIHCVLPPDLRTLCFQVYLHTLPDEWQLPGSGPAVRHPPEREACQHRCPGQHRSVRLSDWAVRQLRLRHRHHRQQQQNRSVISGWVRWICVQEEELTLFHVTDLWCSLHSSFLTLSGLLLIYLIIWLSLPT